MGHYKQSEQRLQGGDDARAPPLPDQISLGFPPLLERGRLKGPRRRLQEGDDARRRRRRRARAQGFLPALPSALTVHKKAPRNHQSGTLPTRGQHLTKATQAASTTPSITPAAQACCRPSFLVPLLERCTACDQAEHHENDRPTRMRPRSYPDQARRPRSDSGLQAQIWPRALAPPASGPRSCTTAPTPPNAAAAPAPASSTDGPAGPRPELPC
jgi:hypothetical protein